MISRLTQGSLAKSLLAVMVLLTLSSPARSVDVEGLRLWRAPDHTRLVFDLSGPAEHKIFQLQNPDRLVVDIHRGRNQSTLAGLELDKTPIRYVRSAVRDNQGSQQLRFVLDLKAPVRPRSFVLKKHADKPHRLVVDLYDKNTVTQKTIDQVAEAASASARRDIVIVIDAGHGGEDPGAIGPRRVREKIVVMDIARQLAKKINQTRGYQAKLTRTGDYYIPLRTRRDFARRHRADLFVSIHADAFKTPKARGASVFALSRRGATSETARFLAQRENDADLIGGVGDVTLDDKDDVLKGVLVDLSMTATMSSSLDVGQHVLQQMGGIAHLHKRTVEQAGFMVLKSPDVPSILVETGFISNPAEAKKLSSATYRKKMATSIFTGIRDFFEKSPPADSWIAWKKNGSPASPASGLNGIYTVAKGDTLSEIAKGHGLSLQQLKQLNKLQKNTIRVGQKLKVRETLAQNKPVQSQQNPVHRVTSGDTLSGIALRYSSSINAIRRINKLSDSSIQVGQTLVIPPG